MAKEVIVENETGLHARPASLFVAEAKRFKSKIMVHKGDKQVDAKSILGIISLAAAKGTPLVITAEGEDEQEAVEALVGLIDSRFREGVRDA